DENDEFVTPADLYRIRSLRLAAESQKVKFQSAVDLAYAALHTAMGIDPLAPLAIAGEGLEFQPVRLELPALLALANARRPELVLAGLGVRNAELEKKLAAAQFRPDVALFGKFSSIHDDRSYPN